MSYAEPKCNRPKTTESCLNCPYPMCKYDEAELWRQMHGDSSLMAINDNFEVMVFENSAAGAKWVVDNGCARSNNKNSIASSIRASIKNCKKLYGALWCRLLPDYYTEFFSYRNKEGDGEIRVKYDADVHGWILVNRHYIGSTNRLINAKYDTRAIAQVVLDNYADKYGYRVLSKLVS